MQTRRDLLQAHRLMTQRAALALLQAEPDPPDQPLRRLNIGLISSILVAVIVAAAFGVWGLLAPGHAQDLTAPGTLIIDSETGTSYILCEHGKLCPVVNYASARLALGTATPAQRTVTQASLAHFTRGPMIGIPGLPEPLPDPDELAGQPWSVCVQTVHNPATLQRTTTTTVVGGRRVGGRPLTGNRALLVAADGTDWVLWQGQRMPVPRGMQQNVLTALAAAGQPAQVPVTWLNAFPQGASFAPPRIAGFGRRVRGPGGGPARIGQVFSTSPAAGGPRQYYVLLRAGLLPVSQTQAALLDAARGQVPPRTAASAAVADDRAPGSLPASGLPAQLPRLVSYQPSAPLCVVYAGPASARAAGGQLTVGGTVPAGGLPIPGAAGRTVLTLPPGKAALAGVEPGPASAAAAGGSRVTSYFLITGGQRFGLASPGVAALLGYHLATQRTLVPAGVIDLIPAGPALDPAVARRPVPG
ncbi:MAG TPA: type VII secretion protein EccB [Streptosporangiaceae bacterium]